MGLRYATVTGVARDDLADGGAWLYAQTAREIHAAVPGCGVELLIPDFNAAGDRLAEVFGARPEVLAHNIETVPRIFRRIRPGFRYERSLQVITMAREAGLVTKSNLILGMGEEPHEITEALADLHGGGLRTAHDHPVPAALAAAPSGGALGAAGGLRPARRRSQGDGILRRHVGPAGPLVLPRGTPVPGRDDPPGQAGWDRSFPPGPLTRILPSMANSTANRKDGADGVPPGRIKQIRMVAGIVREQNPRALPLVVLTAVGIIAVFVIVGLLTGLGGVLIPIGVVGGLAAGMVLFGRFAQSAQYSVVEGQPGAAAAILQSMRGGWTVTPAVSANRNMDVVHRAVGKPGVVLVGEGSPTRLPSLLAAEKKRISRVAYETPIYDFQVGTEAGQVPIRKLQRKIMRLPRNLKARRRDRAQLPAQGPAAVPAGAQGPDAEVGADAPAATAPQPLARRSRSSPPAGRR